MTSDLFDTIDLERLRVVSQQRVSMSYVLANAELHTTTDMIRDQLVAALESHVLAHEVGKAREVRFVEFTATFDEWESWWQHTKSTHFPTLSRWLRRPPRTREVVKQEHREVIVDLRNVNTFPAATIAYPPELTGPRVVIPKQIITSWDRLAP